MLRPLILIPAWSFLLVGAALVGAALAGGAWGHRGLPPLVPFVALTAILITAYLLNQIFDRDADEQNNKCFYISRGIFHTRTVLILAVIAFLLASFAFRRVDSWIRTPLIVALLLSLLYSLPPVRLCSRPFLDLVANAVGYGGVAFVVGAGAMGMDARMAVYLSVPYVLLVGATFLHTAIMDVEGDRAVGKITTVVRIGEAPSRTIAAVLTFAAVATAYLVGNFPAVIVTAACLPATVYTLARPTRDASVALVQLNTLVVALAAAIAWPLYLVLVVPLTLLSRFYHRRRFGIIYPGVRKTA